MPPQFRQVKRIPGLQFRDQCLIADLTEQRVLRFLTWLGSGQAHRLPGHCVVDGAYIQAADGVRRVKGEAPSARHHTGEVVERVVVG